VRVEGLRALVTGGARRIGRAISEELGRGGARLAIHYRTAKAEAEEMAARFPGSVAIPGDLSRVEDCRAVVATAREALGGLDLLVNNASVYVRTPLEEVDEAAWDRDLDTNLKGPFFLAQAAGLAMREAGAGLIVNLTDWSIHRPYPDFLPYHAAKAGLSSLTEGLARALAPEVRVNAVAPGAVLPPDGATPEHVQALARATPLGRLGGPEAVVSAILFLLGNSFITGATITVDGGRSCR